MKQTVVYSARSPLSRPLEFFRDGLGDILKSIGLGQILFLRSLKVRHRQTILGYLWLLVPALSLTVTFVFLRGHELISVGETPIQYAVYVFMSTILWQVFVDALRNPFKFLTGVRGVIGKTKFPHEGFLIASIFETLFAFGVRLLCFIPVLLWFGEGDSVSVLAPALGLSILLCLGFSVGVLLLPLMLLYQDFDKGLGILISVWFFATPVIYPLPANWTGSWIFNLNPVSPVLTSTRAWFFGFPAEQVEGFLVIAPFSIFLVGISWMLYRISAPHLIERLGS